MATPAPPPEFFLGLDLGQTKDPSALTVLQRDWRPDPCHAGAHLGRYAVRHLQRWPLGTSYADIARDVTGLVKRRPLASPILVIDQTGVGAAVVDLIRQAGVVAQLRPVLITAGNSYSQDDRGVYHVAKKELASTTLRLMEEGRLDVDPIPLRELLVKELQTFRIKITTAGNETWEAWREQDHDDIVLAVAIALFIAELRNRPFVSPTIPAAPLRWETLEERYQRAPCRATRERLFGYGG